MSELPTGSRDFQLRNPHLFKNPDYDSPSARDVSFMTAEGTFKSKPRIRQSKKPLLNKLEQRVFHYLSEHVKEKILVQAVTFRLANGVRYTPDLFCFCEGRFKPLPMQQWIAAAAIAWEVKGKWFTDDAIVKLKLFASLYPNITVILVSESGNIASPWTFEPVLP